MLTAATVAAAERGSADAPRPDRGGLKWAEKTLRKLTLEEKVGQLFMVWARARFLNPDGPDYALLLDRIRKYHIGSIAMSVPVEGPVLLKTGPYEAAMLLNRLQADSTLPLLVAADFERGVSTRLLGSTVFPHAMAFGAAGSAAHAEAFGRITAEEARAVGVHWNFFPVADVNSNPKNPIINTRSFGEDPKRHQRLRAQRRESALWRDPHPWPPPRHHSAVRRAGCGPRPRRGEVRSDETRMP